ncbi:MAG: hypothetical protein WC570_00240 [Patescibacteria group bacterium]
MNYEEKMWLIVSELHELSKITPKNEIVRIEPDNTTIEPRLFQPIISKLIIDFKVAKLVSRYTTNALTLANSHENTITSFDGNGRPHDRNFIFRDSDGYELMLLSNFDILHNKLKKKFTKQKPTQNPINLDNVIYKIDFNDNTRQLTLNNILLSTPDFNKNGHRLIEYLFQHQNEELITSEVIKETKLDKNRTINGIINDLGFKGKLLDLFFNISSEGIQFINPITQEQLNKSKINIISTKDLK